MKLAAARLDALPVLGRDFLRAQVAIEQSLLPRWPEVAATELRDAWQAIVERARLVQHHHIGRAQLSVREHMSLVLHQPGALDDGLPGVAQVGGRDLGPAR